MGVIFEEHACYSRHTALIMNEYGIALGPTKWVGQIFNYTSK